LNKVGNPVLPKFNDPDLRALVEKLNRFHSELITAMDQGKDGYLWPSTSVVSDYTCNQNDALIVANAPTAGLTVTLLAADLGESKRVAVKRINAGSNVLVSSPDLIDGQTTRTLAAQYDAIDVISDGDTWHRV